MKLLIFATLSFSLLTSCAFVELSAEQCQTFDWENRGVADGGKGKRRFHSYKVACEESGYLVDIDHKDLYEKGYLKSYCKTDTAFKLGMSLHAYEIDKCTSDKKRVLKFYTEGRKRGTIKQQIEDIDQKKRELQADLYLPNLEESEIQQIKIQIREYEKELRALERDYSSLTDSYIE